MTHENDPNDTSPSTPADDSTLAAPSATVGQTIGPYRLLQILGEGGMGTVYLAEQTSPINRRVALKIIKLGMDTREVVARFESERQALARMSHPNIAKVHDAGATDQGRPYFVMEYVKGVPLTEYCDHHRLDTKARLRIFIDVCQAVHHAHQKGVIHRDLKPQNVLVEVRDGQPVAKVIDFGVARATDQSLTDKTLYTQQGCMIGTPAYMSPEQAEMSVLDIDTTTDVYSLGVMLYELLTGVLPLDPRELTAAGWQGIQSKIRDHQPKRLSTQLSSMGDDATDLASRRATTVARLSRQCRNELDWITLRAMEKDRTRRYQSASEFAADIKRYLADEPVLAHRPSLRYQMGKLIIRNKYRFGLAAGMVVVLVGFVVTTMIQSERIAHERDRANPEAAIAGQVSEFLVSLFQVSDPSEARGNTVTAREILDEGARRISSELGEQPAVRAHMMGIIGDVYVGLGLYDQAEPLLDEALEIELALQDEEQVDAVGLWSVRGELATHRGDYQKALSCFQKAMEIQEAASGPDHPDLAVDIANVGLALDNLGDHEGALLHYERALVILDGSPERNLPYLAATCVGLGSVLKGLGDYEGARAQFERALAIEETALGSDDPSLANTIAHLGGALYRLGDLEGAREQLERAQAIEEKSLGPNHPHLAFTCASMGVVQHDLGNLEEAREQFGRALAIQNEAFQLDDSDLIRTLTGLAEVVAKLGDSERSEQLLQRIRDAEELD